MAENSPSEAYRLVQGFRVYQLLAAACELAIPDLLAGGSRSVHDLATLTDTHEPSLRRFLRGLAMWGVVQQLPDDAYGPTPLADNFRSDRPGFRNMTINLASEGYQAWGRLLYSVQTGEPAFDHMFGKSRWAALAEDPIAAARFNAHMVEQTGRVASGFVANYDFTDVSTAIDVAGGNGALLAAVLEAKPDIRGVLFDLPAGLAGARDRFDHLGLADRLTVVEGSFFESIPADGDLYMLKSIVHDWDDERARAILKTCRAAMKPSARLVLIERILPERIDGTSQQGLDAVMLDLHMMVVLGGRERTSDEYRDLLASAGLRMTGTGPAGDGFGTFEAAPA